MTFNVKKRKRKQKKQQKETKLHIYKTLYKSYLMNVGTQSLQEQLRGCHFFILDLKTSTLSQHFISDGTISHIFGPKYLKELDP